MKSFISQNEQENAVINGRFEMGTEATIIKESIKILGNPSEFNVYTDETGDKIIGDSHIDIINSPESLKEMEIALLGIKPDNVQDDGHWLENEIPIAESSGLAFVGTGKVRWSGKSGHKISLNLCQNGPEKQEKIPSEVRFPV